MRAALAIALMAFTTTAGAFQPRTGHWNNLAEGGRGFNFDFQDGIFVLTFYSYDDAGNPQWYLSSGALTNGGKNYVGSLDKYRNGQCLTCAYGGPPAQVGNDGNISIVFTSETTATVTLPGGRVTQITPYNFRFGDPPPGLLGEWIYVYDIISTFAERFSYTRIGDATSTGTGIVADLERAGTCEYQKSGSFVGKILCFDFNSALTAVENQYLWTYGLDETYSGSWISPTTFNSYAMKGFRTVSKSGFSKGVAVAADDPLADLKASQEASATGGPLDAKKRGELAEAADRARAALAAAR